MNTNFEIAKEACQRISNELLPGIEDAVFPWAENREKLYKSYEKEIRRFMAVAEEMPEEYLLAWSNQFVAGKIFASSVKLKKFLNQIRDSLNRQEKQLIRFFLENQWFYSLFSIEELLEQNFIRIYDHSQKKSLILFSEGVYQHFRYGVQLFLCLLFFNGECYQTYGVINFFKGYTVKDFQYFAGNTSHHYKKDNDLSDSIFHNPVPFMLLCRFSEIPLAGDNDGLIEYCHHSMTVEEFNPEEYSSILEFQEKDELFRGTPKTEKNPGKIISLYYEQKRQTLHVLTNSYNRYLTILKIINKKVAFPKEPSLRITPLMRIAVEKILGVKPYILKLAQIFEERMEPEVEHKLSTLNAAIADIFERHAHGEVCSLEELQKTHGLTEEEAKFLQNDLKKITQKFHIDLEGGLKDFEPPPPVERIKFTEPFLQNSMFRFNNSPMAFGYFRAKLPGLKEDMENLEYETLSLKELPAFIEDLFFEHWNTDTCAILFYTIYLLSKKGEGFNDVRAYAIEFLRLFWQIILPSKEDESIEEFIKSYGFFCFDVLYRVGLIEVDRELNEDESMQALYKIKAAPFFFEWIKFYQAH